MNKQILENAGIDCGECLKHFMNDERLFSAVLSAFANDSVFERARAAYRNGDMAELRETAHEAKGSSGSANITGVYNPASELVLLLRRDSFTQAEVDEAFKRFDDAYTAAQIAILAALKE